MANDNIVVFGAVVLSIIGNTVNAFGYIVQKLAHMQIQKARNKAHKALFAFKLEKAGFLEESWKCAKQVTPRRGGVAAEKDVEQGEERRPLSDEEREEQLRDDIVEAEQRLYTSSPLWLCGFATYGIGSLLIMASLGFGPQALLMPLEGITLAANAVLAPMFLGERVTSRVVWSTAVIIIGLGITVSFGPHASASYDSGELLDMLVAVPFLIFVMFCVVSTAGAFFWMTWVKQANKEAGIVQDGTLDKPGAKVICLSYIWIASIFSAGVMLTAKQAIRHMAILTRIHAILTPIHAILTPIHAILDDGTP